MRCGPTRPDPGRPNPTSILKGLRLGLRARNLNLQDVCFRNLAQKWNPSKAKAIHRYCQTKRLMIFCQKWSSSEKTKVFSSKLVKRNNKKRELSPTLDVMLARQNYLPSGEQIQSKLVVKQKNWKERRPAINKPDDQQ